MRGRVSALVMKERPEAKALSNTDINEACPISIFNFLVRFYLPHMSPFAYGSGPPYYFSSLHGALDLAIHSHGSRRHTHYKTGTWRTLDRGHMTGAS